MGAFSNVFTDNPDVVIANNEDAAGGTSLTAPAALA
jgi:hypothetical protein